MLEDVLLWGPILAGAAVLILLSTYTRGHRGPTAGPDGDRTGAPLDSALRLQCDSLKCGHMQRPHDITASGRLVCRRCHRTYSGR
ncbi:hypothetical protein ACN6LM_003874 [Streptomyces sp. SAS_281]|uniref:hypothetical protein n=1 Tax=Streptomyces sp. SAS_281 TaxID=3412744 RepID=UPI00403D3C64